MPEQNAPSIRPLSRRRFLKITAVSATLLAGGRLLWPRPALVIRQTRTLMGTVINLAVVAADAGDGRETVGRTFTEMERLIHLFDHRRPGSPLARLNRQGHLQAAPAELVDLLSLSLAYSALTEGAFDVTVKPLLDDMASGQRREGSRLQAAPVDYRQIRINGDAVRLSRPGMAVTLDGIAKGRVVDGAVTVLRERGFDNVLVEAGGDLFGSGHRADGTPWRVGVTHPRAGDASGLLAAFSVSAQAVATSGDYQNYFSSDFAQHHIVDPRSRQSPAGLASVTVLAPTATDADALSTATMVLGVPAGLALLEDLPHVEGLLVTKELERWHTTGFPL